MHHKKSLCGNFTADVTGLYGKGTNPSWVCLLSAELHALGDQTHTQTWSLIRVKGDMLIIMQGHYAMRLSQANASSPSLCTAHSKALQNSKDNRIANLH